MTEHNWLLYRLAVVAAWPAGAARAAVLAGIVSRLARTPQTSPTWAQIF